KRELLGEMYGAASVVLNTSHSEGSPNAVLEAMAAGKAVLASDVPGNRALVPFNEDDWETSTGVLYATSPLPGDGPIRSLHDAEDFYAKARRLALDPEIRRALGSRAREHVLEAHSPERELERVLEAYRLAGVKCT